ncbi:MAG: hypothetical protein K6E96_02635 [Bacteroidales bacterium]|nr:hypothetical protein [Bacteroidales bacterium]
MSRQEAILQDNEEVEDKKFRNTPLLINKTLRIFPKYPTKKILPVQKKCVLLHPLLRDKAPQETRFGPVVQFG